MNENESAAMWKLYSSSSEAVCIRSTYRRLRLCLPQCVLVGEVNYINYEIEFRLDERIPKDHLLRRIDGFVTAVLADMANSGITVRRRSQPFFDSIDPQQTSTGVSISMFRPLAGLPFHHLTPCNSDDAGKVISP